MRLLFTILLSSILLSCSLPPNPVPKPFDPKVNVSLEIKGDSVTLHRHFQNNKGKSKNKTVVLPTITTALNDSAGLSNMVDTIVEFIELQIKEGNIKSDETPNISVRDNVLFESVFNVWYGLYKKDGFRATINGTSLQGYLEWNVGGMGTVSFANDSLIFQSPFLGFRDELTTEIIDSIKDTCTTIADSLFEIRLNKNVPDYQKVNDFCHLFITQMPREDSVTTGEMLKLISLFKNCPVQWGFHFPDSVAQDILFTQKDVAIPYINSGSQ